jgi:hypothetical protein
MTHVAPPVTPFIAKALLALQKSYRNLRGRVQPRDKKAEEVGKSESRRRKGGGVHHSRSIIPSEESNRFCGSNCFCSWGTGTSLSVRRLQNVPRILTIEVVGSEVVKSEVMGSEVMWWRQEVSPIGRK